MTQHPQPGYPPQPPDHRLFATVARLYLGDPGAKVVEALASYGRLTVREISHKTGLGAKATRSAVVSLTQLNCLFYWQSKKDVVYSFNPEGLYVLLHAGDIIAHVQARYGSDAAQIVQNVLANGSVKIADYCGPDGGLSDQTAFFKLFSERWLTRLQPRDYSPLEEVWQKMFAEVLATTPRSSTTSEVKRVAEAQDKTKVKFMEYLEQGLAPKDLYNTQDGLKRLKPELVVRVNWSRYLKHLRTRALVNLAASRVGALSAKVLEAGLRHIEQNSPTPGVAHPFLAISGLINDPEDERSFRAQLENKQVEDRLIVFGVHDVVRQLAPEVELAFSTGKGAKRVAPASPKPAKKIKTEDGEAVEAEEAHNDDQPAAKEPVRTHRDPATVSELVAHHLDLLARGTATAFITETTPGNFLVPFTALTRQLKQFYFETIIKATFGDNAFRVLRCLKAQKVGDEKSISNAVLLREKTVRNELYKLIMMNMVEIQEVPRSADRAAMKTFFLFRHNPRHAYDALRSSLMFDMAQVLARIDEFKDDHKILLAKCDREDVKGHEEELLLESELKTLKMLQHREVTNMVRFNRLKSLYNVLSL
ncbi:DNA-directed RNA polymerase III subunit RPC3 [Diutina catenulata]